MQTTIPISRLASMATTEDTVLAKPPTMPSSMGSKSFVAQAWNF